MVDIARTWDPRVFYLDDSILRDLVDIALHIIQRTLSPGLLIEMAP